MTDLARLVLLTLAVALGGAYLTNLLRTFGFMSKFVVKKPLGCNVCMSAWSNVVVMLFCCLVGIAEWWQCLVIIACPYLTLLLLNHQSDTKAQHDFPMPEGDL